MKSKSLNSGFTLIEVMIVVIIIAALATMIVPSLMGVPDEAKKKIAKGDMSGIETALKVYRLERGSYPTSLEELRKTPEGRETPYLEKKAQDPWGNLYIYQYPKKETHLMAFDLYSCGPNGKDDGAEPDDVTHWDDERV